MEESHKSPDFKSDGAILVIEQLYKSYQLGAVELQVLRDVNLAIKAGESVAIMGPSGSGKSTLLNIIGCLDRPTSGHYWLGGQEVSRLNDTQLSFVRAARIGFVFQSFNLIEQLNVIENIEVPMYYRGLSESESASRAGKLALMVGLGDRLKHRPSELSGGERQRVAIARALANEPLIILADEPTGNLDSETGREILDILLDLHRQGKTLIVVTHDDSIATHSERIINLLDGHIKQ